MNCRWRQPNGTHFGGFVRDLFGIGVDIASFSLRLLPFRCLRPSRMRRSFLVATRSMQDLRFRCTTQRFFKALHASFDPRSA